MMCAVTWRPIRLMMMLINTNEGASEIISHQAKWLDSTAQQHHSAAIAVTKNTVKRAIYVWTYGWGYTVCDVLLLNGLILIHTLRMPYVLSTTIVHHTLPPPLRPLTTIHRQSSGGPASAVRADSNDVWIFIVSKTMCARCVRLVICVRLCVCLGFGANRAKSRSQNHNSACAYIYCVFKFASLCRAECVIDEQRRQRTTRLELVYLSDRCMILVRKRSRDKHVCGRFRHIDVLGGYLVCCTLSPNDNLNIYDNAVD